MSQPLFTDTQQIAIVVPDLYAAMQTYVEEYGIGPWKIFEFNPSTGSGMIVDDKPVEYAMRVGLAQVGAVEWELIEPLDAHSIYAEFLAANNGAPGLHHVAVKVADYHRAVSALRSKGHTVRQGGQYKGHTFAYMSTDRDLGALVELVDVPPGVVHVPDAIYPSATNSPEAHQPSPDPSRSRTRRVSSRGAGR
jgi:hypothetical protein